MISLGKPSTETIRQFLDGQRTLDFSYPFVGATATRPPAGFVVDQTRIRLGSGAAVFAAGKAALERWDQFRLGWLEAYPSDTPLRPGEVVAILARSTGLCWIVACRIIYVINENGPINRFGFAYGTLPDHAATGEERFLIEWNRTDDSVWYDILAFSVPAIDSHAGVIPSSAACRNAFGANQQRPSCGRSARTRTPQSHSNRRGGNSRYAFAFIDSKRYNQLGCRARLAPGRQKNGSDDKVKGGPACTGKPVNA